MTKDKQEKHVLRVRDPGGPFAVAYEKAYYQPFTAATGIHIDRKEGGQEPTELIRQMVESQNYLWDVALTSQSANLAATLSPVPALEEIGDTSGADIIPGHFRSPYFQGDNVYSFIFAHKAGIFADGEPQSWRDFWDAERFPCRRSLRRFPMDVLEAALLSLDASPDDIYPLDVDQAFSRLSEIRDHIDYWWTDGGEQQLLLSEDRVDMCAITSLRAVEAIRLGADIRIVWNENIRTCQGWGVLKGTPRVDLARVFLEFVATPERQAALCSHVGTSPAIPDANEMLDEHRKTQLPDGHLTVAIDSSPEYWSRNKPGLISRFEEWMASE